jgi:serine protease AprX
MYLGGTSMATPLVAGYCAVLRETLVKNGTPKPSAALIKALLINGAVELVGQYTPSEAGRSPNDASGWGRVDVANSIIIPSVAEDNDILTTDDAGFRDEATPLDTFDEFVFKIPINGAGRTLKITLGWTDAAGAELQNDLDLISSHGVTRLNAIGTSWRRNSHTRLRRRVMRRREQRRAVGMRVSGMIGRITLSKLCGKASPRVKRR